jgi:membrane dipeptidase
MAFSQQPERMLLFIQALQMQRTDLQVLLLTTVIICTSMKASASDSIEFARDVLIVDTHIDVPYRVYRHPEIDVTVSDETGDFDLPRMQAGGLNAAFMSIFIPASVDEAGGAKALADDLINLVHGIVAIAPEKLAIATCVADIYRHQKAGLASLPMGIENGAPIEGNLDNVSYFREKGIRYITLAHSKSNHISDSSYDTNEHWGGLSDFGKQLIPAMNDQGIMVDISHLSDAAAWQVLEVSKTPVIASHSALRHFVPGFHRNMTDEMVKAVGKNGGVVQINFGSSFVTAKARTWMNELIAEIKAYKEENQLDDKDPTLTDFRKQWAVQHPFPFAGLSDVLDHIGRVVDLAGIDHVGIGSDYDGVGKTLPVDLKDVSSYPNLVLGLRARGYPDEDIAKILGGNFMRVWAVVEKYAVERGYPVLCSSS